MSLEKLREELLATNFKFLDLLADRRKLVSQILTEKQNSYDPSREWFVFAAMGGELQKLDQQELLAFSLIMEGQVREVKPSYPSWSAGEHLDSPAYSWKYMLNPLLLKLLYKRDFDALSLRPEFEYLRTLG